MTNGLCKCFQQSLHAVGADSSQLELEALGDASWPDLSHSGLLQQPQEGGQKKSVAILHRCAIEGPYHASVPPELRGMWDHLQVLRRGVPGGLLLEKTLREKSNGAITLLSPQTLAGVLGMQAGSTGNVGGCGEYPEGRAGWAAVVHGTTADRPGGAGRGVWPFTAV